MDKLEIVKLSLFIKQNVLIAVLCFIAISIFGYFTLRIFKRNNVKIPQDISEWKMDLKLEAEVQKEMAREKRERNRIINDIANAVRKRL